MPKQFLFTKELKKIFWLRSYAFNHIILLKNGINQVKVYIKEEIAKYFAKFIF